MQTELRDSYNLLSDLLTETAFLQEIQTLQKEYQDLIDPITCGLLLVDKYGRNKSSFKTIHELEAGIECSVNATVIDIQSPRTFSRKNGNQGSVQNLIIQDTTGSVNFVLWNEDLAYVKDEKITIGTPLKIINAYTKKGYTGELELHLGRYGRIDFEQQLNNGNSETSTLKGILTTKNPTQPTINHDGTITFTATIQIKQKDEDQFTTLTIFNDHVRNLKKYQLGSIIEVTGAVVDPNNPTHYQLKNDGEILVL